MLHIDTKVTKSAIIVLRKLFMSNENKHKLQDLGSEEVGINSRDAKPTKFKQ